MLDQIADVAAAQTVRHRHAGRSPASKKVKEASMIGGGGFAQAHSQTHASCVSGHPGFTERPVLCELLPKSLFSFDVRTQVVASLPLFTWDESKEAEHREQRACSICLEQLKHGDQVKVCACSF